MVDGHQQLAKLQNIFLNTTQCTRNLGFIFGDNLTFFDQISSLFRSCYYQVRQLRCVRPFLDFKQLTPSPHLLYVPNLTAVIICTLTFLRLR